MTHSTTPFHQDSEAESEQLRFALRAANVGTWDYNLLTNQAQWSAICKALFGLPADADATAPILLEQVHPDDRERVALANSQVLGPASDGVHDITFRTLNPEGVLRWVQAKGQVVRDAQGQPTRFSGIVIDVTQSVLFQQKVAEAEEGLRGAIELAELGTWSINLPAVVLEYSPRLRDWLGIRPDELITVDRAYSAIASVDRPRVKVAMLRAIAPGSKELYDVEYTTSVSPPGRERILVAQGRAFFDQQGQAYKISGTVQDVTQQRQLQQALEQQVQQRTEEIATINEELTATNEELIATNEELLVMNEDFMATNRSLETANNDLTRSNQNLEQFAYIASHDLQEPLRKIQQFGDLLQSQYGEALGEGVDHLKRMQSAASRMSILIKDLLTFSRIATTQVALQPVSLTGIIDQVREALSIAVEESGAQIQQPYLPTVLGDESQLRQLFQNLLSNALKFRRQTVTGEAIIPQITIRSSLLSREQIPASLSVTGYAEVYHKVDVIDNGIGFDEKYRDKIFQVFQRLNGKNEFAGTGIGLAIVQKVVTNHRGAITVTSQPGQGATFSVYLPA